MYMHVALLIAAVIIIIWYFCQGNATLAVYQNNFTSLDQSGMLPWQCNCVCRVMFTFSCQ